MRRTPRSCGRGGAVGAGGHSASFRPSAFPGQATKRVSPASCCPWGAWPPISLRFVLARLSWARSVRRPGTLARARLFSAAPAGAGGWGGGAGRAPAPLSGGGGGPSPLPRGVGAGAPAACGPVGGGGGGVSLRGLPDPLLGGGLRYSIPAPLVSSAHPLPACACGRGRGAAPGRGGVRGGPWTAPPGAPADLNPPSALPEWAVVTGGSCRARPPYCSGGPPCAAPKLGARVAPARWCGLALRPRPPRGQAAGGAGARGVQAQPHPPPPPRRGPFWGGGGGASPRLRGGGGPLLWLPSWGGGAGGGGGGGAAPPPPRPVGRRPAVRCVRRAPLGCTRAVGVAGRPRASGAVRSAADGPVRRGGGGGGRGGRPLIGPLRLRSPGRRRSAVGRQRAGRAGVCPGRGAPAPRVQRPPRGVVRGRRFFGLPPSALGPGWAGGGGVWGGPSGPLAPSPDGRGGAAWRSRPRGPAIGRGVAPFPRPPLARERTLVQAFAGAPHPPCRRRAALAGRGRP